MTCIAEIETDKATMEVEAVDEGTLGQILIPEGTADVAVNTPIATDPQRTARTRRPLEQNRAGRSEAPITKSAVAIAATPEAKPAHPGRASAVAEPPQPACCLIPRSAPAPRWSTMTMREALRDAMAEEMRRDADVFVMGEEVAEYQGAYKVTQGLLQEFSARRVDRHADHRARLRRPRCWRGAWRGSSRSSSS